MPETHDYDIVLVRVTDLNNTHVMVGDSGGLSAVYDAGPSSFGSGLHGVATEHGMLLLDPDAEVAVLDL